MSESEHGRTAHAPRLPAGEDAAPARLEAGLGFRLSRLTRTLRAEWAGQLEELGLTPPQAAVLRALAGRPGCSLRALARLLGTEPMRAKRCVDELERRDLVQSAHRGGDRRPRSLQLTGAGEALAQRVDVLVQRQEGHLDAALGAERRGHLEAALAALETVLDLPHPAQRSEEHR